MTVEGQGGRGGTGVRSEGHRTPSWQRPGYPAAVCTHPSPAPCSPPAPFWGSLPRRSGAGVCAVLPGQGRETQVLLPDLCCDMGGSLGRTRPCVPPGREEEHCCAQSCGTPSEPGPRDEGPSAHRLTLFHGENAETQRWRRRQNCALTRLTHLSGQWLPEQRCSGERRGAQWSAPDGGLQTTDMDGLTSFFPASRPLCTDTSVRSTGHPHPARRRLNTSPVSK